MEQQENTNGTAGRRRWRPTTHRNHTVKGNLSKLIVRALSWLGGAVLYFILFSLLFDTPAEYEFRKSTDRLQKEYELLEARYDSLTTVVENVVERDRNVFGILFESEPYDFYSEYEKQRLALHEKLLGKSNRKLVAEICSSTDALADKVARLEESYARLQETFDEFGEDMDNIPSIQPVTNHELTLLTAGYGNILHPFYREVRSHQGVDYTLPEGSRIFATADGVVTKISGKSSISGLTVEIDHLNGYTTSYSHLQSIKVQRGAKVNRGDIIALSGNSGLSLTPHLHYEVRHDGNRIDPTHFFFMELSPDQYERIQRIAQSGMQSFD